MAHVSTFTIEMRSERGRDLAVLHADGVPIARLLDGHEPLPADEVLATGALLPADPPRRIALYECACGGGVGCGNVSWVISERHGRVRWKDAASASWYAGALPPEADLDEFELAVRPSPLDLPDLAFAAEQYHAEIQRVVADVEWRHLRPGDR
ncbi:hypothetical protein [Mumia sp. Pv 4-285]|uniref:hypothetical protein n=1 Tax=Mumia qirimensis TaxID=3234852 RepID=UPI00351D5B5C